MPTIVQLLQVIYGGKKGGQRKCYGFTQKVTNQLLLFSGMDSDPAPRPFEKQFDWNKLIALEVS